MTVINLLLSVALATLSADVVYGGVNQVPLPTINYTEWWGPDDGTCNDTTINNFTIVFNETMIADLKSRLANHRPFTPPLEGTTFDYGFSSDALKLWMDYLAENYTFSEREAGLNNYSHYKTCIQGLNVHFMRVKSKSSYTVMPLLIAHGSPSSVREFYETIPYLISKAEAKGIALDIIMPSLPGFGFSDGAARPGLGVDKVAVIYRNLMHRIGYSKYCIQGGDMGGMITNNMATFFPDEVLGYHTNFPFLHNEDIIFRLIWGNYHQEEMAVASVLNRIYPSWTKFFFYVGRIGYLHIQATRPDTFGIGLSDSPAGLMSHMLITTGTPDNTGTVSADALLDNFMIFWMTNCETTSIRLYSETFNKRYVGLRINDIRTPVPIWVLQTPNELIYLPPWMIKMKYPNFLNETLPATGGHFYAWQNPEEFATDVVSAVVAFIDWHVMNNTYYENCTSYITV